MKSIRINILVVSILLIASSPALAAKNTTKTYQLSVTVPVIVGLNDHHLNSFNKMSDQQLKLIKQEDVTMTMAVRNNIPVTIKSLTVK